MGQLLCRSRTGLRTFIVEEAAFADAEKWYTSSGAASFSAVEACDDVFIDGGGAIMQGEPTTSFVVNDVKISTFKRHIPFIIDILESISTDKVNNCVMFSGHMCIYILTIDTKNALVAKLKTTYEAEKREISDLEAKLYGHLSDAGVLPLGKCSCISGKPYKDCCGGNHVME